MAKIILDFGSGNTCKNNWDYTKQMLDELKAVDTGKHEIIIKWQLFKEAGDNIPLDKRIFDLAYVYAEKLGYKTTASIFDKESLEFLLQFDVPMIKIANNRSLDWLIGEIPRRIPVYVSGNKNLADIPYHGLKSMACISKYPAEIEEYEKYYFPHQIKRAVSDHTTNWDLFNKYKSEIIEVHYGLSDSTGLDAGLFMRTPAMLAEVL